MKTRNGFVSNSSSSSFVVVAYKAKKKTALAKEYRTSVEKNYSAKLIKKYALDYFATDDNVNVDDFDKFPLLFWKEAWRALADKNQQGENLVEYDVPNGLMDLCEEVGMAEGFVGICLSNSSGDTSVVISPKKLFDAVDKVKRLAPSDVDVQVYFSSDYD